MGLHLYCIVDGGQTPPPELQGLGGAPVTSIAVSDLAVWCSPADRRPRPDLEGVRVHDRVIRQASIDVTPLPFRFGQWFQDRNALETAMLPEIDRYRRTLSRVSDAVEFAVRLEASGRAALLGLGRAEEPPGTEGGMQPSGSATGGAAFLRELARRQAERARARRSAGELLADLDRRLAGRVRQVRPDRSPARGSLASAAHLVPRRGVEDYLEAFHAMPSPDEAVDVRVSGPWPPYSFT